VRGCGATFGRYHRNGALGQSTVSVDNQHTRTGPRKQDCRCAPVADAITRGAAASDDGNLAGETGIVFGSRSFTIRLPRTSLLQQCYARASDPR
jgi:hypothetical protein